MTISKIVNAYSELSKTNDDTWNLDLEDCLRHLPIITSVWFIFMQPKIRTNV